jgi:hypothetical protein
MYRNIAIIAALAALAYHADSSALTEDINITAPNSARYSVKGDTIVKERFGLVTALTYRHIQGEDTRRINVWFSGCKQGQGEYETNSSVSVDGAPTEGTWSSNGTATIDRIATALCTLTHKE